MSSLVDDLNARLPEAGRAEKRDILASALDAARAPEGSQRGWTLLHLAGAMRDHEDFDAALSILDLVAERFEDDEGIVRATFSCAVAIHGDRGETELANVLCDEQRSRGPLDVKFLRAELRARQAWLDRTGEEAAYIAREVAESELSAFESVQHSG